jgi:hypothetical protein
LAAGIEGKLDVPEAGDAEAAALGVTCQRASVADLFVEFVDGHGWCRLTAGSYPRQLHKRNNKKPAREK